MTAGKTVHFIIFLFTANGFVRSEGAVVLFLQREQDAKRQYAKLLLCDTIFEGLSSHTLLGYDEEYLKNSLSKIYERNENASVVEDVAFVELTGCAVKVQKYFLFFKLRYRWLGFRIYLVSCVCAKQKSNH